MSRDISTNEDAPVYYANGVAIAVSKRDIAIGLMDGVPDFLHDSHEVTQKLRATVKLSLPTGVSFLKQFSQALLQHPDTKEGAQKILNEVLTSQKAAEK